MLVAIQDSRLPGGQRIVNINRRRAIKENCFNCSGYSRKGRENCWAVDCQLYLYRTGQGKQDSKARNKAIRTHCRDHCMDGHPSYVTKCPARDCPLFAYRMNKIDQSVEVVDQSFKVRSINRDPNCQSSIKNTAVPIKTRPKQLSLFSS